VIAGLAAVAILVAVAVVVVLTGNDKADAAEVLLEPVAVEVPDPFTSTVAIGEKPLDPTAATSTTPTATATDGTATRIGATHASFGWESPVVVSGSCPTSAHPAHAVDAGAAPIS